MQNNLSTTSRIETGRLVIVPFSEELLSEKHVSWLNDPEIVAFSEQRHRRHTLESCRAYMNSFVGTSNHFWAIIRRADGVHIGNTNAYVDVANRIADVGILIGERSAWGQGFGLEAWKAVCDHLLDTGCVRKITAGTMSVNTGMIRIFEKYGMQLEGVCRKHFLCGGQEVDFVLYAKFRPNHFLQRSI